MTEKVGSESAAVLETIGRAFGSKRASHQELAAKKVTVVKFDQARLDALQARLKDVKEAEEY